MKLMILIITFSLLPFLGMSQTDNTKEEFNSQSQVEHVLTFDQESIDLNLEATDVVMTYYRKVDLLSDDPIKQYEMIQSEKSQHIISVKAYIQSLQMKRKATLMS